MYVESLGSTLTQLNSGALVETRTIPRFSKTVFNRLFLEIFVSEKTFGNVVYKNACIKSFGI